MVLRYAVRYSLLAVLLLASLSGSRSSSQTPPSSPSLPNQPDRESVDEQDDWAAEYLEDPLATEPLPTLAQLQQGLQDPKFASRVIPVHFPRATELSRQEQQLFLTAALEHPDPIIRQQSAVQLRQLGLLGAVIADRLRGLAMSASESERTAGIVGLQYVPQSALPVDQAFLNLLIANLATADPKISAAAADELAAVGAPAVPALLEALDDPAVSAAAAVVLGRISQQRDLPPEFPPLAPAEAAPTTGEAPAAGEAAMMAGEPPGAGEIVVAKSRPETSSSASSLLQLRAMEEGGPETVRVFFGTNREQVESLPQSWFSLVGPLGTLAFVMFVGLTWLWHDITPQRDSHDVLRRHWLRAMLITPLCVTALWWVSADVIAAATSLFSSREGAMFGSRRSASSSVYYGYCDVSIPPNHKIGLVESPLLGIEDESKHVVLKKTTLLEEEAFFETLRSTLRELVTADSCFVFIHGYNVSFDAAAKRTAQIFYDLDYQGLPIFYSWPSRASLRHYFSDRNEVLFSRELIKQFLIDVAEKSGANRVHVIAHSMGADAVTQAIAAIDSSATIFDQIILAAPDIDADTFKQHLLPKLQQRSRRTTLYCSKNDLALHMSFHFNDSWRAGDSSRGLLIAPGLDTIDASWIDTELLGHSYYGNCLPILRDFSELMLKNTPPAARNLISIPLRSEIPAWTFPELQQAPVPEK